MWQIQHRIWFESTDIVCFFLCTFFVVFVFNLQLFVVCGTSNITFMYCMTQIVVDDMLAEFLTLWWCLANRKCTKCKCNRANLRLVAFDEFNTIATMVMMWWQWQRPHSNCRNKTSDLAHLCIKCVYWTLYIYLTWMVKYYSGNRDKTDKIKNKEKLAWDS